MNAKGVDRLPSRFMFLMFPGVLQAALSILVLPFATLILTPADYGAYALVLAFTGVLTALASMGSAYILSSRFRPVVSAESCALVSTLLFAVLFVSLVFSIAAMAAVWIIGPTFGDIAALPFIAVVFALVDMVASAIWGIANSVSVLSRRVRAYALFMSARAVAVPAALLSALFVLDIHGPMALFCGSLLGGLVYLLGTFAITAPYLRPVVEIRLLKDIARAGGLLGLSNLAETGQRLVERSLLASNISLAATGIFTHAQLYPNTLLVGVRPALHSAWPKLCEEAREQPAAFSDGRFMAYLVGLAAGTAAVALALVGPELIGALTNGRFVEAAPYAAILTATIGLRFAGRPQHAVIIANGHTTMAALVDGLSAVGGMVLMALFIPIWGLPGAAAALAGNAVFYLALLYALSQRIRRTGIHDGAAFLGFGATALTLLAAALLQPAFLPRLAIAVLVLLFGALAALAVVRRSGLLAAMHPLLKPGRML